jgi:hypothetical protein
MLKMKFMHFLFLRACQLIASLLQLLQMKNDIAKRAEKAKIQEAKYRENPDIVVKVTCRYRAELFFKISRKTKLSRLFNTWTERMENGGKKDGKPHPHIKPPLPDDPPGLTIALREALQADPTYIPGMQFIFTHNGRSIDAEQTPEEVGMEDNDEILAVELMDLTEGPAMDEFVRLSRLVSSYHPIPI